MAARNVNDPVWARDNQGMNVYRQARIVRVLDPTEDGVPRYEVRWCDGDKLSTIYPVPFICTEANFDPRDSRGRAGRAARRGAASTRPEAARHSTAGVDDDYPPANAHAESSEEDRPAPAIAPAESSAESVAEQHHQTVAVANAESMVGEETVEEETVEEETAGESAGMMVAGESAGVMVAVENDEVSRFVVYLLYLLWES